MKEIQITLYEIFGYLVPGFVFACAVSMVYWTTFETHDLVVSQIDTPFWMLILMVSYLAGHAVQGIANLILRSHSNGKLCFRSGKAGIGDVLIEEATNLTKEIVAPSFEGRLGPETILEVCDAMIDQCGSSQTREIYLYREGFYRGMFIALFSLSIGLAARAHFKVGFHIREIHTLLCPR